jgi:pyruvate kinase
MAGPGARATSAWQSSGAWRMPEATTGQEAAMQAQDTGYRLKLRRTKIVATLGPASSSPEVLRALLRAGVDVARLNFSHGTHEGHQRVIENVRQVCAELGRSIALLGDLCGPKIRVGLFAGGGALLREGQRTTITTEAETGTADLIPSQYAPLIGDIAAGRRILLDDGKLELEVVSVDSPTRATCAVLRGGLLRDKKGMNLPDCHLSVAAMTDKDHADLRFCIENGVDYVALSFVRKPSDIVELKASIAALCEARAATRDRERDSELDVTRVIAKIEMPEALEHIEEIVDAADGIMVARGDLGVELPLQRVPIVQNHLIRTANRRHKPVIVATQMLESMIDSARPTRAEVSDAANAVFGNTDAVMLSAETASGQHPLEAVRVLDSVLREVEGYQWSSGRFGRPDPETSIYPLPNALAQACTLLSREMAIRAVNVLTDTGSTARLMSSSRPSSPIFAYCSNRQVARQMHLYWGVVPIALDAELDINELAGAASTAVQHMGIAEAGQHILLVASTPTGRAVNETSSIVVYQLPRAG